jgi:uncharacterized protein
LKVQRVTVQSTSLRVWRAETMRERMRGLLGRAPLAPDEAMLLRPCRLVHTFGMKYPIDVVFLDRAGVVRRIFNAVPRARVCGFFGAWQTLELAAGSALALGLCVDDRLAFLGRGSGA